MANGLLSELRRLAESSKDIPQEAINRLILGALAEVVDRLEKLSMSAEDRTVALDKVTDAITEDYTSVTKSLEDVNKTLTQIQSELITIKQNPFIQLGSFVKRHPKTSLVIFILTIAAVTILVTSKPFVVMLLTLAGIPSEAIEQLLILVYH